MSNSAGILVATTALVLAGCTDAPRRGRSLPPDWEQPGLAEAQKQEEQRILEPPQAAAQVQSSGTNLYGAGAQPGQGSRGRSPSRTGEWVPLQRWSRDSGVAQLGALAAAPQTAYALRSPRGVFSLTTSAQLAHWDGLDLYLGFAPQSINGQPYVNRLDLDKSIRPLLETGARLATSIRPVVVIDPGHGGSDSGTRSILGARWEKEFTLDWALRLRAALTQTGWQAVLTRSSDTDMAISNRVTLAEQLRAGLFISLHFNSAGVNHAESGLETYCLTPAGMASSITRGYSDEPGQAFPNNAYDEQNLQLAACVHRALLEVNGHHDRGVRRARFPGVLRGQQRPAILVEGGYLSCPREAGLIAEPHYRQQLAEAVARAVNACANGKLESEAQTK